MDRKLEVEVFFPFWVAYAANLQIIRWSPVQMVMSSLFPLGGLYLSYLYFTRHHSLQAGHMVVLFVCFFFTPLMLLLTLFLGRRRNPLSKGPFKYVFDEEGMHASGPVFNLSIKWAAIQKVRESGSFLFFFLAPGRGHALPVAQLAAASVLSDLRQLSREQVTDTKVRLAQQSVQPDRREDAAPG
jgi:hypothetical protein